MAATAAISAAAGEPAPAASPQLNASVCRCGNGIGSAAGVGAVPALTPPLLLPQASPPLPLELRVRRPPKRRSSARSSANSAACTVERCFAMLLPLRAGPPTPAAGIADAAAADAAAAAAAASTSAGMPLPSLRPSAAAVSAAALPLALACFDTIRSYAAAIVAGCPSSSGAAPPLDAPGVSCSVGNVPTAGLGAVSSPCCSPGCHSRCGAGVGLSTAAASVTGLSRCCTTGCLNMLPSVRAY
jgi:hypothetical protein